MTRITLLCSTVLMVVCVPLHTVRAQEGLDRGLEFVKEVERRSRGFVDLQAKLDMEIHDSNGRERLREMTVRTLESPTGDRTLMVLNRPADLAGTAFLSVMQAEGRRAQWIYLPTARRVRRIGGSQGSDAFLGSHFTYADMAPPTVEGHRYRWVRGQDVDGHAGALIERCASECVDGAARALLLIDTERYLIHRVDYFDAGGVRTRTLRITDYQLIEGFWRAHRMEMSEAEHGGRTVLRWSDLELGIGLRERDFDPTRLGEVR